MSDLLPEGPERDAKLARLAQLEQEQQALLEKLDSLNAEIDAVRGRVKPQIAVINEALAPIAQEIDGLRLVLFPRMSIGG